MRIRIRMVMNLWWSAIAVVVAVVAVAVVGWLVSRAKSKHQSYASLPLLPFVFMCHFILFFARVFFPLLLLLFLLCVVRRISLQVRGEAEKEQIPCPSAPVQVEWQTRVTTVTLDAT